MEDPVKTANDYLAALRREFDTLKIQVRASEETIERSRELIRKIDKLLARSPLKP